MNRRPLYSEDFTDYTPLPGYVPVWQHRGVFWRGVIIGAALTGALFQCAPAYAVSLWGG